MMKKLLFEGCATALITPFREGKVDFSSLGRMIDGQLEGGIDALVVCGTTGESAVLSDREKLEILAFTLERVNGRIPVIIGTGSNDTAHTAELSRQACREGADGLLAVTPYYNKPTQEGLFRHFWQTAESSSKPVLLYQVPSRTGCSFATETLLRLAEHENIGGLKDAGGNVSWTAEVIAECREKLPIYSGNDDLSLPIITLGGKGVISVAANLVPKNMVALCRLARTSETVREAAEMQLRLLPLMKKLFAAANPIPVKTAMAMLGWCREEFRLPLCELSSVEKESLSGLLREYGLAAE